MGEMLSTGFGVVGFNWISSPAATELESIVMDWLGQALNLPERFLFSSNVGGGDSLCSSKAASVAGIHPENLRAIKTKKSSSFALSPYSLLAAILHDIENGLVPCFLCATVGTTTTAAVDPIGPLCDVAKDYGIWVHVDAAYAGGALICPEFRHFIDGVEGQTRLASMPINGFWPT
ncbi:hypothetical protein K1719_036372 [Acacia pycnantha]|nr:hypothetical protein K1719_036372 [Acacia pycnantha]